MKTLLTASIALAIALPTPLAFSSEQASQHNIVHRAVQHEVHFARATALAPQRMAPERPAFAHENDGLGRENDDCVMGCADH